MKPILKKIAASYIVLEIFALCVVGAATLMSGCLETTTTEEYGTQTYNVLSDETVVDIDCYSDGLHITGKATYSADGSENALCNVDGYIDGNHVTGYTTITNDKICYDWYMKVDYYQSNGHHVTGYKTLKGCGDDVEWYRCLTAVKDGYKTQYMSGHADAEWRT